MESIIREYVNSIKEICPKLTSEDEAYFVQNLTIRECPSKAYYIHQGEKGFHMGYIAKGLVRVFYYDEQGNDISLDFLSEGMYTSDYTPYGACCKSRFYFQCLEDCIIINMPYSHFTDCSQKIPNLDRYICFFLERSKNRLLNRVESFLLTNTEMRYLRFIEQNPNIYYRIPITHLATYLGVSRQALTKVRKNNPKTV